MSNLAKVQNQKAILSLTALWGLVESGLGGFLFALRIPLTGFLVGGFAILIIILLASFSTEPSKQIIKSTILVLLIKGMVSPHAPITAYIAVGFQGFSGALFFFLVPKPWLAAVLLGFFAMAESAMQKILVLTIVFGSSLWDAVNTFFDTLMKDFNMSANFSWYIIVTYVLFHALWGIFLGAWGVSLPGKLNLRKEVVIAAYQNLKPFKNRPAFKRPKRMHFVFLILILFFVIAVILFMKPGESTATTIFYFVVRASVMLLLLFFVLRPVVLFIFKKGLNKTSNQNKEQVKNLLVQMEGLKKYILPAWQMTANKSPVTRVFLFIQNMLILTLYLSHSPIYIFSRPVRTGKTTGLQQWVKNNAQVAGILTPDVEGRRILYDIASNEYRLLQVDNDYPGDKILIGRYVFSADVLQQAQKILIDASGYNGWLIIDEVGKLEVYQNAGLEPVISSIIEKYKMNAGNGKLLLVIRKEILADAIRKYNLQGFTVLDNLSSL
ncbi:MAG: hypothetical protein IPL97_06610 [Niastella sp.]|nr:hypothetical protein [Niastella sp.]